MAQLSSSMVVSNTSLSPRIALLEAGMRARLLVGPLCWRRLAAWRDGSGDRGRVREEVGPLSSGSAVVCKTMAHRLSPMQCKSLSEGSDPPTAGQYVSAVTVAVAVARQDGARSGGSELGTDRSAGNLGKYSEQQCKGPAGRSCSINIYNGIEVGGGWFFRFRYGPDYIAALPIYRIRTNWTNRS